MIYIIEDRFYNEFTLEESLAACYQKTSKHQSSLSTPVA